MRQTSPKEETMSRSASPSKVRFLLDENVNKRLEDLLSSKRFDVSRAPKGFSNGKLAGLSKTEKRVLVTNDDDFTDSELYSKDEIFSVVLLKVPQDETEALLKAFSKLLDEREEFEGYLIVLAKDKSEAFPLPTWTEYKTSK